MGLFGGASDRRELLELRARVARLEEEVARLTAALAAVQGGSPMPAETAPTVDQYVEARAAAAAGKKIEAMKIVREQSGLSLKTAKDLVESW
jgi:ribosomal protein L7/L12